MLETLVAVARPMRGAMAAAMFAALLIALPAQAIGPAPDPEQAFAEAWSQVPPLPETPTPQALVTLFGAAVVAAGEQTIAAVWLAEGASDDAFDRAIQALEAGMVPINDATMAAGAAASEAIRRTPAECYLQQGLGCATWLAWYYPGMVHEAIAIEQSSSEALLATSDGFFAEYDELPGSTPTPGVILNPGVGWTIGTSTHLPEYAFASAQHTLVVADALFAPVPESGLIGGGFGTHTLATCQALECNPAYVVLECVQTCGADEVEQALGLMTCQSTACDPLYPEKHASLLVAGYLSAQAQRLPDLLAAASDEAGAALDACIPDADQCAITIFGNLYACTQVSCAPEEPPLLLQTTVLPQRLAAHASAAQAGATSAAAEALGAEPGIAAVAPLAAFAGQQHRASGTELPALLVAYLDAIDG